MSVFSRALGALDEISGTLARAHYCRELFEMSDAQLAARGLRRDQIVQHAMSGK